MTAAIQGYTMNDRWLLLDGRVKPGHDVRGMVTQTKTMAADEVQR